MSKKQFILETLLPYKENPSLCGYSDNSCDYLTHDGKKCAVGKHMRQGEWQKSQQNYTKLIQKYNPSDFFTAKALAQNLSREEWIAIQQYHDTIAMNNCCKNVNDVVNLLEITTGLKFPELNY
jgi:hypothetical protein